MKFLLLVKGFCIISFAILVGCNSIENTRFSSKKHSNSLKISLTEDMADGQLDIPFEQACLIASGVDTYKKMQRYLARIDFLIFRIENETDIHKASDPLTRAKILFDWLQKNTNEGVYEDSYDLRKTLNLKVGNCLSYAIQFTIICRHFGIDVKNILIPGHIYTMLAVNGEKYYFEHTHSDGIVKRADRYHPQKKIMKDTELISEIFLYKARNANRHMKYEKSTQYCQQALHFSPHDHRPVILLLDNYLVKKNYKEAFRYLNEYLLQHPDEKKIFRNTYILLQRLGKKGDNNY
jgi:tetratricopeptide (TPR) repeat protein